MHDDVRRLHGYHPLAVREVVQETADTRSYVLDVPDGVRDLFDYRPGQFCTFRVHVKGDELLRCYSMSSAPETDAHLTVTVKRVPGGAVSNWFHDHVEVGDELELTPPAGVFCLPEGEAPVLVFCGGSGVTPVLSITKHALTSTDRQVRMVYANRDADSVIFREVLDRLTAEHGDRLHVRYHLDSEEGFLDAPSVAGFVADLADDAVCFLCGPTPFMDMVESALMDLGVDADRIFIERFGEPVAADGGPAPEDVTAEVGDGDPPDTITFVLEGRPTDVAYHPGDTVLETARRGGLAAPYSCEAGNCATCMALVHEGAATMRANNALTPEEVQEGWVLTCQALPHGPRMRVEYESF